MKITGTEFQAAALDGAVAVGGGGALAEFAKGVPQIVSLVGNIPATVGFGINPQAILYGVAALLVLKLFQK